MKINCKLPDFTLLGTDGVYHSPSEYATKEVVVLIFTCSSCVYAKSYQQRIKELVSKYEKKKVGFFAIDPSDSSDSFADPIEDMLKVAKKLNLRDRYLHDETQGIAATFDVHTSLEVFVFNDQRKLIYKGAIDDNWENSEQVTKRYLESAIQSVLSEKPLLVKETPPIGSGIKWRIYN